MARRVVFEVPELREHAELLDFSGGVEVHHFDHAAMFQVPQWLNPRGHYVYVVWGENEIEGTDWDVLYVGMSSKILMRLAQHATDSPWWSSADHIDIYQYATRDAALAVETWLINQHGPTYNVHYARSKERVLVP